MYDKVLNIFKVLDVFITFFNLKSFCKVLRKVIVKFVLAYSIKLLMTIMKEQDSTNYNQRQINDE